MPDFEFGVSAHGHSRVELTLRGQMLDVRFARALMARSELTLAQVLLLDRVQKGRPLHAEEVRELRELGLIEGRSPRLFISAKLAEITGQKARYIHNRGLDDGYYQRLVLDYLGQYGKATRADLDALLLPKLPDVLTAEQKANKLKNLLQAMRRDGLVHTKGPRAQTQWLAGPGAPSSSLD
jgi:ATP-dependent DNA helicase RecG